MKMDHDAFRTALPLQAREPSVPRLGPARLVSGALFLLLAPILILGSLVLLCAFWAAAASWMLIRDCVVYAAEVTVGRPSHSHL